MSNPVISAIVSIGKIREREAESSPARFSGFYTLILFGLVVATLMVALLFATTVYGAINNDRVEGDESRAALNVVANSIRQSDASDFVTSKSGPEGSALVLVEHTKNGDYETRFYLYNGVLMQEYSRQGTKFNPDDAVEIAKMNSFSFEIDDSLITVSTDKGQVAVAIRSDAVDNGTEDDVDDENGQDDQDTENNGDNDYADYDEYNDYDEDDGESNGW